jgi:hypothetical protein
MSHNNEILESHVFVSDRKEKQICLNVFEKVFTYPLEFVLVEHVDQPDEIHKTINDRAKKILLNIPRPEKIKRISGRFSEGGSFYLENGDLHIQVSENEYNYELVDSLKGFLSPTFPLWLFKNPYIWGATIFEAYERQHFFESRSFSCRSKKLDDPEIDIYRRDDGIIHKYRFFLHQNYDEPEEGLRFIESYFKNLITGLRKRNYEPLEVFQKYCSDKSSFRQFAPRTKLGKDIKSILNPDY